MSGAKTTNRTMNGRMHDPAQDPMPRQMTRPRARARASRTAAFFISIGIGVGIAGAGVSASASAGAGSGVIVHAAAKADTVVTSGCLKAADEMGEPAARTHDANGAPYFVLTNTQPTSGTADGITPGALYRVIGLSPRMLRARANTQVEVIGKVEPGKAAALGGPTPETTPGVTSAPHASASQGDRTAQRLANSATVLDGATAIDSLPAINAKSIRTLSPRCAEDEGR